MDAAMNGAIRRMAREIADILGPQTHSVWLYGSVTLNDFQLGWSDIDCIAFSRSPITQAQADSLLTLRQRLSALFAGVPYYHLFEGIIVDLPAYREQRGSRCVYWGTSGQRVMERCPPDPFARYELARYGQCILGDCDRGIFAPPDRQELTAAVRRHDEAIRRCAVQTDERLYSCGWLLDIARCIYTLRTGQVISKTQAGEWALNAHIFADEAPLEKALMIRRDPLRYLERPDTRLWLSSLGPTVQRYADRLEAELAQI